MDRPDAALTRMGGIVATQQAAFAERFGKPPAVTASAPGRINVIGEHTDYNDGLALPGAIDRRAVVTLAPRGDDGVRVFSDAFDEQVEGRIGGGKVPDGWGALPIGAGRLFADATDNRRGFDAVIGGNLPIGAGVASSAAVEVALLNALRTVFEVELDDLQLVRLGQRVENEHLQVETGLMDQCAAQFAQPDSLMLIDFRELTLAQVPARLDGWVWLLLDSGVRHELAASAYGERVAESRAALEHVRRADGGVRSLRDVGWSHLDAVGDDVARRRARHYLSENERVQRAVEAVSEGSAATVGELMSACHASLRDDYEVSCDELDLLADVAAGVDGCAGARMMGGGFGGCTLNLVHGDAVDDLIAAVFPAFRKRFGNVPAAGIYRLVGGASVYDLSADG